MLYTSADYNTISLSTLTNNSSANTVSIDTASNNTISQSYIANPAGPGMSMNANSNYTAITLTTILSSSPASAALWIQGSSSTFNTITQSIITNLAGPGVRLYNGANYNTISQSTLTSNTAGYSALYASTGCSYNTVTKSFIVSQGGDWATL